jgi:thioredoxin reductase (NADPH)
MGGFDYEVIILGSGPAGLQAAIHAARAKVSVAILGREAKSSISGAHVENFCCLGKTDGGTLLDAGRNQAKSFGTVFLDEDVIETSRDDNGFVVKTESGSELRCGALILAMGISRKKLKVPGEKELLGKGVSYCVDCDANFFRNEKVAVVGDESAAGSGALTLLMYADEVHLITRSLNVTDELAYQVNESAVMVHQDTWVKEIEGQHKVEGLVLENGERLCVSGVFIELGAKGAIELAAKLGVALDSENFEYIVADKKQATNVPGVFAAGDICGPPWQVAKAVGEGCVAGLEAAAWVKKLR